MAVALDTPIRTNAQNLERVLKAGLPALLIFEIPGCEPCRSLEPTLKDLARDFAGKALIVRIEDVQEANLAGRYNIDRVPTIVLWKDGQETGRVEGSLGKEALRSYLNYLIGAGPRPSPAKGASQAVPGRPQPAPQASSQPYSSATRTSRPETGAYHGPVEVTDATFESQILRSDLPVLVDFWAPWCGPCRMVSPIVEALGQEYSGRLKVAKVNTDENPGYAGQLGIQGIPTLIIFKNGREVDRIVGAVPRPQIQSRVERVLST